jgi:site-specific DNA-methyltransferase (adenine-specific)
MVKVFREVWRVLKDDGTLWVNLGDSYAGSSTIGWRAGNPDKNGGNSNRDGVGFVPGLKPKDLCGIPWRLAFALQSDGWYLRSDIIWHKPNPMPESVQDRCTKSHEYIFLLTKQERYYYNAKAIAEPVNADAMPELQRSQRQSLRNRRSVWTVATQPYAEAHFATFPENLIKPCILAGSRVGDTVLDPFAGSGTTGRVAIELGRSAMLIELNPKYAALARDRTNITPGFL